MPEMRALSVRQPWAWLIVNGFKDIENRTWPTNVRGRVAIHAAQAYDEYGRQWVQSHFPEIAMPAKSRIERGKLVGTVEIIDCVATSWSRWFNGPFGFVLANAERIEPFSLRGRLGFFSVAWPDRHSPSGAGHE